MSGGFSVSAQLTNEINQYMVHQPFVNFSSATSYQSFTAAGYYRNQWVGFNGAPQTFGLQVQSPLASINSSVGLRLIRDQIGVNVSDQVALNYAYRLQLKESNYLSFSLSPKMFFKKGDLNQLITTSDQSDPLTSVSYSVPAMFNAELGAYYFKQNFYLGFAIPNILVNNVLVMDSKNYINEFRTNQMNVFIHSGYQHNLANNQAITGSVLMKTAMGANIHGELNALYSFKSEQFGFGVSYRTSKEWLALVKATFLDSFTFSYAYQHSFTEISSYQNGTHELMMIYQLATKKKLIPITSPRF